MSTRAGMRSWGAHALFCLWALALGAAEACAGQAAVGLSPSSAPAPPAASLQRPQPPTPEEAAQILRRQGTRIVDGLGREVRLRGVAFGNNVWGHQALPTRHHGEVDFARVAGMGMNAVRFYLYYGTFEDDAHPFVYKPEGWRWLDDNIAWARAHHVYLVLNMHVPQGGFQSNGDGGALWNEPRNQDRLVALWTAVAARYAHEPVIAGYDLLNEPGVSQSKQQWQTLAARLTHAIRSVDAQHLVIVERVNSIAKKWDNDAEMNFVTVDDPNVVYTFHFYEPFTYTHQLASWVGLGEAGAYPDEHAIALAGGTRWIDVAAFDSPTLPSGDTPWTFSAGLPLQANDPRAVLGHISLVAENVRDGQALFDDLRVEERDERGAKVRDVLTLDLKSVGGWSYWSKNGSGVASAVADGHEGLGAVAITGTTGDANLGGWSRQFPLVKGHTYVLSGWMKGVRLPSDAKVQIRLDFLGSNGPVLRRDKSFLAAALAPYLAWGKAHQVPLFLGEFGVFKSCFEKERGGLRWVEDVLDLIDESGLSFTYHSYHEDGFGLYHGSGPVDPRNANQPLIDLFSRKLAGAR